jgi:hypothetical protein
MPSKAQATHGGTDMADITMCAQTQCPNAGHCYRVQAQLNSHWQSVAMFKYTISTRGVVCDNYLPTTSTVVIDSTGHNTEINSNETTEAAPLSDGGSEHLS